MAEMCGLTGPAAWVLAGGLAAAGLAAVAGCSGGPAEVFQDNPAGFFYEVNVEEPMDVIICLVNLTGQPVRLRSIEVPAASDAMRLISVSVYDQNRVGSAPATAVGILPAECPGIYVPAKVSSLTVTPYSDGRWVAVVTISFRRPGRYLIRRFRIRYTTSGGSGWQDLIDPIQVTVREPARPGPTPVPSYDICPKVG